VLCDLSQRSALEVQIERKRDYLWIETVLEKALIHNETLTTRTTFEYGLLA
jgi:hypothetical protein